MANRVTQKDAPMFEAYKKYALSNAVPFHVPGHKMGRGADSEFARFIGENALKMDLTMMPATDNLQNPTGPAKQAQQLAAQLYGADRTFFCVHGTSGAIEAMILSAVNRGDKIIVPRNIHKSVMAGVILSGAVPVFMHPAMDERCGIAHSVSLEEAERVLADNPDAKAILILNPTYYGVSTDVRGIAQAAHGHGIPLLVDEAHGAHLRFCEGAPSDAISCGADIVCQSTHKNLGSLTQSSMLHVRSGYIDPAHVEAVFNLLHTTSPSCLLLASLDCTRRNMALNGKELWAQVVKLYRYARAEINKIDGLFSFGQSDMPKGFAADPTKLTINCRGLGITGYELEKLLFENYGIQMELSDYYNVLAVGSPGDTREHIDKLISALSEISVDYKSEDSRLMDLRIPNIPEMAMRPGDAFFAASESVEFLSSAGRVSSEFVMGYPPGIPVLCPGERITQDIVDYSEAMLGTDQILTGMQDKTLATIKVVK